MLEREKAANGDIRAYRYYSNGRVYQELDEVKLETETRKIESGNTRTFLYDLVNGRTTIVDARGNEESFFYDAYGNVTRQIHADRTRSTTKWGLYETDPIDPILLKLKAKTEHLRVEAVDEVGATETFHYYYYVETDSNSYKNRLLSKSVSKQFIGAANQLAGIETTYQYGAYGSTVKLRETVVNDVMGTPVEDLEDLRSTQDYDGLGRLVSSTDAELNKTTLGYYPATDAARAGLLKSALQPKGQFATNSSTNEAVTWHVLNSGLQVVGGVLTVRLLSNTVAPVQADAIRIDRIGKNAYEKNGGQTVIIDEGGPGYSLTLSSGSTLPVSSAAGLYLGDAITIPANATHGANYALWTFSGLEDGLYRISTVANSLGANYEFFIGTALVTPAAIANRSQVQSITSDFRSFETIFDYDAAGNLKSSTIEGLPAAVTDYFHTGAPLKVTDAAGVVTQFVYDATGRVLSSSQSGDGYSQKLTSTFTYDGGQQLRTSRDALGRLSEQVYDKRGNVTKRINNDQTTATMTYDREV